MWYMYETQYVDENYFSYDNNDFQQRQDKS